MLLKGNAVAKKISEENAERVSLLKENGITPTLAIFRIGSKEADLSYERGILKRFSECGVEVRVRTFAQDVEEKDFIDALEEADRDEQIHGILVFRPLPKRFAKDLLNRHIDPRKDVDGCTDLSLTGLFVNKGLGFAPCTAQAAIEILDYYEIPIEGKNVVVLGRSLVIGKPVAMLLLNRNATVTICHRKTKDTPSIAAKAEILVSAIGECENIDRNYVSPKQTVVDIGINYSEEKNRICGDVLFEEVEPIVENITPVPGGVGSVTTSILARHVIEAAERINEKSRQ